MNLLMITQKIDLDDDILGFTHTWIAKLSKRVEKLYVLALWVGRDNFPDNVEVYSMGKEKGAGKLKKFMNFNKVVSRIVLSKEVDSIFIHMCPQYAILASPYAKLMRIPMVMWYTHKSTNLTLKIAHLLVKKVMTASEESFRLKSKKKIVTGHGIDVEKFKIQNSKFKIQNSKFKILSVGRISPIKDYETLVESANLLVKEKGIKDIEFLIVGDIGTSKQKSYLEKLKSLVEKYNLKDFIHFIGSVPHYEIAKYYQGCDVFVNLSRTDSLDKTVLEAMSCQKLVLTSNIAFKQMLIRVNHNLTFENGNYKELTDKTLNLLNLDIEEVERIGRTLRNTVTRDHSVERLMEKLVLKFRDSATFNPSYVGQRNDIARLIPTGVNRILDIGCSVGTFGKNLKESRNSKLEVIGIEVDEKMAEVAAQRLDKVIVSDIEIMDVSEYFELGYFDCIIFADVLEHLRNPWTVLGKFARCLNDSGVVIASIPNVRHYSVLFNLIFKGCWPYKDRGINDRTHLRFFTLRNIYELYQQANLSIISVGRKYRLVEGPCKSPVLNKIASYANKLSRCLALPLLREFVTFQYLIVAKKAKQEQNQL